MKGQCTIGACKNAGKILEHFRNKNLPLVHVQHLSSVGSEGVKIHDTVKSLESEKIGSKILPEQFQRNRSFTILK
ncbi:hypothetical protein PGH12_00780 [Chryseobacterium wangxinyae]|nr:hypothetical protein [Chryseobacterium sp. CY350]WBZ95693.1 hypothetical protein PGH12_00780 [Chryseobacterium sp. CY350]